MSKLCIRESDARNMFTQNYNSTEFSNFDAVCLLNEIINKKNEIQI